MAGSLYNEQSLEYDGRDPFIGIVRLERTWCAYRPAVNLSES